LERTLEALKVAGINAANARADADAAESFASSLASQLESLRNVVQETTRATKVLKEEHEAVAAATRFVESNLLKRETELFHLQRDRKAILKEHEKLKESISKLSEDKRKQLLECQRLTEQVNTLNREIGQHGAMERSRKCRSEMLERELSDVRSLLVVASSTAVETETTTSALKETIERVLKENKELHQKIEEIQETFRSHFERLQDALVKAEKTTQTLRIDAASHSEQMNRVLSEKACCEKTNNQLKGRITNLEQRLKDTTEMFSSPSAQNNSSENLPPNFGSVKKYVFSVPSLASPPNDTPSSASKSCFCCICLKVASGMMKTCKCGKGICDKRAHSTCIAKRPRDDSESSSHLDKLILCCMTSL
jgi:chromosome segregation ATPase